MSDQKRAVILAGGKGTRLRPYTVVLPKPLMPIGDYPILEVVIRQLVSHGFERVTLAVNHQADLIKSFFGDGSKWGVDIDYSLEDKPLSTMGPLKLIPDLPENFLIMNGDLLTNLDYSVFYENHIRKNSIFTISSYVRELASEYGVLEIENNKLSGFKEKPKFELKVSMGIYMANKAILDIIPVNQPYGFDHLMLELINRGNPASVRMFDGYWLDIGREEDYRTAIDSFENLKHEFLNV